MENNWETSANLKDAFYVIQDEEHDFYWVIDLEDHPNSFLLDKTYQNLLTGKEKSNNSSMIVFQPIA
jgi:hypothetical protein